MIFPIIIKGLSILSYIALAITIVLGFISFSKASKSDKISEVSLNNQISNDIEQEKKVAKFKFQMSLFITAVIYFIRRFLSPMINGLYIPNIVHVPGFLVVAVAAVFVVGAIKTLNKGKIIKASVILLLPAIIMMVYNSFIVMHLY